MKHSQPRTRVRLQPGSRYVYVLEYRVPAHRIPLLCALGLSWWIWVHVRQIHFSTDPGHQEAAAQLRDGHRLTMERRARYRRQYCWETRRIFHYENEPDASIFPIPTPKRSY